MAIGRIPEPGTGIPESIVDAKGDIVTATAADTPARLAVGTNEHRLVAASGEATGLKYVADTTNYAVAAKGDLLVGTAADTVAVLSVGTNGHTLVADSSVSPQGLKWAVDPVADVVTTAGDLLYATAADTVTRLGIGTAGQVLKVNSGATAPEWGAASGGSLPTFRAYSNEDQSLSANTWTKKVYQVEDWDTAGNFASSRFTPTTAGYYVLTASQYNPDAGTLTLAFYKNGSINSVGPSGGTPGFKAQNTTIMYFNGTTDYVEVFVNTTQTGLYNGSTSSYFTAVGVRN